MDFYSSSFTLPRATTLYQPTHVPSLSATPQHPSTGLPMSPTSVGSPSNVTGGDRETPASIPLVSRIPSCLPAATHHSPPNSTAASSLHTPPLSATSNPLSTAAIPVLSSRRPALPSPEAVSRACADLMAQNSCLITYSKPGLAKSSGSYTFHISGSQAQVMAARGRLLRENPFEAERVVRMSRTDVLEGGTTVRPQMKRKLDEVASVTRAHLSIVGSDGGIGEVDVVIRGEYEAVEQARVRLLVLFDQLSGLHSDVCEIDYKLHHIIAGRKRAVIQSIQEETATNIYFPCALSGGGVLGTRNPLLLAKQNTIFITGEYFGVQRAREMLFQVSLHKSKCIISRDTALLPRKLDWVLKQKLEQVKQIMHNNGTFINFPAIGSQTSVISVYGDNVVPIERTIRTLMQLVCEFYTATVWLLPPSHHDVFSNGADSERVNQTEVGRALDIIAAETGAELIFKGTNTFEIYGTKNEVIVAVERLLNLEVTHHHQVEVRFQVELACEHRDFISGKKNGKLNKIMKGSNVKIKFETFNDYNFLIDLSGTASAALAGLPLLQEELPAEMSFHIPEPYHKRIIGVGGKNIQRIMKKYGVYVKFSNAEEFASLGGYADNHDNVIARTPAKNFLNLENLKQSVMELVHPKDKNFILEQLPVPRQLHRTLLGEKGIFLHDIENKTGTHFYFPSSESGIEAIEIFGPDTQIHLAIQMTLVHVGLEAERRLPVSQELLNTFGSEEFKREVVDVCKAKWNVTVLVLQQSEEVVVKFGLTRANVDLLRSAKAKLETFLAERKIETRGSPEFPTKLRGRSRTASSSFSVSAFTPTTPTDGFPLGPGAVHHLGHHQDFKPFDHSSKFGYAQQALLPAGGRLYNPFVALHSAPGVPGKDWPNSVPRQMVPPMNEATSTESARLQQQQISEQIRRLSARAQSLDLGIGMASVPNANSQAHLRHRISQSGSLIGGFGGLGIGL